MIIIKIVSNNIINNICNNININIIIRINIINTNIIVPSNSIFIFLLFEISYLV